MGSLYTGTLINPVSIGTGSLVLISYLSNKTQEVKNYADLKEASGIDVSVYLVPKSDLASEIREVLISKEELKQAGRRLCHLMP